MISLMLFPAILTWGTAALEAALSFEPHVESAAIPGGRRPYAQKLVIRQSSQRGYNALPLPQGLPAV